MDTIIHARQDRQFPFTFKRGILKGLVPVDAQGVRVALHARCIQYAQTTLSLMLYKKVVRIMDNVTWELDTPDVIAQDVMEMWRVYRSAKSAHVQTVANTWSAILYYTLSCYGGGAPAISRAHEALNQIEDGKCVI